MASEVISALVGVATLRLEASWGVGGTLPDEQHVFSVVMVDEDVNDITLVQVQSAGYISGDVDATRAVEGDVGSPSGLT